MRCELRRFTNRFLAIAIAIATMTIAVTAFAPSARAANADPCGVITQSALAGAFGLAHAEKDSTVLRSPGNSAGVLHDRCKGLAWKGTRPRSPKSEHAAIVAGTAADVRLEAWVPDESPFAERWHNNFPDKIQGLTTRARQVFVQGALHGRGIALPRFGAEHSRGFLAMVGKLVRIRALWWSTADASIVSMNVIEPRRRSVGQSLGPVTSIARRVVPAIG